jgi:hypothetical protein
MRISRFALAAALSLIVLVAPGLVLAQTVTFDSFPSLSWPGGTFSSNLSGGVYNPHDGFYEIDSTSAYNGFGMSGEYILFNAPVTLDSLVIQGGASAECCAQNPSTITVSLYNNSLDLIGSILDTNPTIAETMTFNDSGVSEIIFTYTGGTNFYDTGITTAWYEVSDITYAGASPTPEVSSFLLFGTGLIGIMLLLQKKLAG